MRIVLNWKGVITFAEGIHIGGKNVKAANGLTELWAFSSVCPLDRRELLHILKRLLRRPARQTVLATHSDALSSSHV
jgi:hypothetical protein